MTTNAEGVETQAQFDELRLEGCDEVQGYLFSKPVPRSEVTAVIARLDNWQSVTRKKMAARLPAA